MAKNITLLGASYSNVPAVNLPQTGGGTARFTDTSVTTAVESDVASGKIFIKADGSIGTGSSSGGGGGCNVTQDAQGYIVLPEQGGGGGSITVESLSVTTNGTYTAPTGKAYSPVTVNVSGGGDTWSWMGRNPTKVQTFTSEHVLFKDTDFASWTWTTTNTTIRAAQTLGSISMNNAYDYILLYRYYAHYDYGNWSPTYAITEYAMTGATGLIRYANSTSSIQQETTSAFLTTSFGTTGNVAYYYNSSGTLAGKGDVTYGLYMQNMNMPSVSFNTATFTSPILYARGYSSYFTSPALSNLDMEASYFDTSAEVWRVDTGTANPSWLRADSVHTLNNGL